MGITDLSTPALKINRLSGVFTGHSIPLLLRLFTGKRPQGLRLGRRFFHCGLPRISKVLRKMIGFAVHFHSLYSIIRQPDSFFYDGTNRNMEGALRP